jgi:toxin ParE1/3/4
MSAPSLKLRITSRAARDIRNIQRYTLENWGPDQAIAYGVALDLAFKALRDQPHLGKSRDELRSGLRRFPIERHTIYYRPKGDTLIIHRIVHQRLDATREPLT